MEKDEFVKENFFNSEVNMEEEYYNNVVNNNNNNNMNDKVENLLKRIEEVNNKRKVQVGMLIKVGKLEHTKLKYIALKKNTSMLNIILKGIDMVLKDVELNEPELFQ